MSRSFFALLKRDLQLGWRQGNTSVMVVAFFIMAISLFPFGVGPEMTVLGRISAGVLWVALLFSAMLSLDRLFQADFEDGSLEQLTLSPTPLSAIVFAKCVAHWINTALPLIIATPIMSVLLNLPSNALPTMIIAMLIGSPALSFIGAVGAGLTVAIRRGGVLVSLLVLPLYIPSLIFGVSAVDGAINNIASGPSLLILAAISLFSMVIGPLAATAAIRLALE